MDDFRKKLSFRLISRGKNPVRKHLAKKKNLTLKNISFMAYNAGVKSLTSL